MKKIILSRKGFDSSYGKGFSPILPNGKIFPIPIPSLNQEIGIPYNEIYTEYGNLEEIIGSLGLRLPESRTAHLDPDIVYSCLERENNWRGIFGQTGAASSHLKKSQIEIGDIFLFFGSFKPTFINENQKLVFKTTNEIHLIFGYLIIGDIIQVGDWNINDFKKNNPELKWAFYHPHLTTDKFGKQNTIYVAAKESQGSKGYGAFYYNKELILTNSGCSKSIWRLPSFFHYKYGTNITRHGNYSRYLIDNDNLILSTVGIGQEFVISGNPNVNKWAESLISCSKKY